MNLIRSTAGASLLTFLVALAGCGGAANKSATDATHPPIGVVTPTVAASGGPVPSFSSQIIDTPESVIAAATMEPAYSPYESGKTVVAALLAGEKSLAVYDTAQTTDAVVTLQRNAQRPLVVVAVGNTPDRLLVELPIRPNGRTGWIDRTKVSLASHDFKVIVELSAYRLVAMRGTQVILDVPIGVGKGQTPTPNGVYYITELLKPPTPGSTYGTYAYGLSGFSEVLKRFGGGDGQVGIHGTNDPSSIGKDVSHGCIRLNNADIEKLVPTLPLGTPVEVRA